MKLIKILIVLFFIAFLTRNTSAQGFDWNWAKASTGSANIYGTSITIDLNGNVYAVGDFVGYPSFGGITLNGTAGIFIIKYDSNGNVLWAKSNSGGSYCFSSGISTDAAGNV